MQGASYFNLSKYTVFETTMDIVNPLPLQDYMLFLPMYQRSKIFYCPKQFKHHGYLTTLKNLGYEVLFLLPHEIESVEASLAMSIFKNITNSSSIEIVFSIILEEKVSQVSCKNIPLLNGYPSQLEYNNNKSLIPPILHLNRGHP